MADFLRQAFPFAFAAKGGESRHLLEMAGFEGGRRLLVVVVGSDGSLLGHEGKYLRIARRAQAECGMSVAIFSNPAIHWLMPGNHFGRMMAEAKAWVARRFACHEIDFFGFSSGASFGAFHAYKYPEIKRLLLVNPPLFAGFKQFEQGAKRFAGEKYLIGGELDPQAARLRALCSARNPCGFAGAAMLPGVDHNFTGRADLLEGLALRWLRGGAAFP
jgi:pimeloyl-ACP methyl ester carboxylesterase